MIEGADKTVSAPKQFVVVPDELKERPQWVVWRLEGRDGKSARVPYSVDGSRARVNNASTSTDAASATEICTRHECHGFGYVLTAHHPFCGMDLDGCRDSKSGEILQVAEMARILRGGERVIRQMVADSRIMAHRQALAVLRSVSDRHRHPAGPHGPTLDRSPPGVTA